MKSRFNPLFLYLVGLVLTIGQVLYFYPRLPEKIASHFGPGGEANGWMSKDSFMVTYGILLLGTAGMLGGIGLVLGKIPTDLINLPNKEYWLAPERRTATLATIQEQMSWFGAATMVLLIVVMQLVFEANLIPEPHLDNRVWFLLGAYLVYTAIWSLGWTRRFGKKG
jgi:uncharacterized membrane protein